MNAGNIPPSIPPVAQPLAPPSAPAPAHPVVTEDPPSTQPAVVPQETVATTPLAGSNSAPQVEFAAVPSDPSTVRAEFKAKYKLGDSGYLRASDPRLTQALAKYAGQLTESMKQAIGANPRGLDFMHTLEKAQKGQSLTRDDIQSLQLFLLKDTRYGSELSYQKGNTTEVGMDGKYGARTHAALERFMTNFQPTDIIPDPYYQELDRKGVAYSKYTPQGN